MGSVFWTVTNYYCVLISQVDMATLVHMSDDDLKAMGIPMVIISY